MSHKRGIKNNDAQHIKIKEFKKLTKSLTKQLTSKEESLEKINKELTKNMESNKEIMFDKDSVKVKKSTIENIQQLIGEAKKISEYQSKLKDLCRDVERYTNNYSETYKQNKKLNNEVSELKQYNLSLKKENKRNIKAAMVYKALVNKAIEFVYGLSSKGYIPKSYKEDFDKQFSEFISGKPKNKDGDDRSL